MKNKNGISVPGFGNDWSVGPSKQSGQQGGYTYHKKENNPYIKATTNRFTKNLFNKTFTQWSDLTEINAKGGLQNRNIPGMEKQSFANRAEGFKNLSSSGVKSFIKNRDLLSKAMKNKPEAFNKNQRDFFKKTKGMSVKIKDKGGKMIDIQEKASDEIKTSMKGTVISAAIGGLGKIISKIKF